MSQNPRVMLGIFNSGTYLPADVTNFLNTWTSEVGKGICWYSCVEYFGPSAAPVGLWEIDAFAPVVSSGLIKGIILNWAPCTQLSTTPLDPNGACTQDIANGLYDTYIAATATDCKNQGYPIIIRLGAEMNGTWEGYGTNPAVYVAMWQRVVNIFKAVGATNVKFHWCPNYSGDEPYSVNAYYPGDQYVDYVGIDLYATNDAFYKNPSNQILNPGANPGNPNQVSNVYDTYPNKPYLIGEWGIDGDGGMTDAEDLAWLDAFLNVVESCPNIIGMVQWHYSQYAVDTENATFTEYIRRLTSPVYTANIVTPTPKTSFRTAAIVGLSLLGILGTGVIIAAAAKKRGR